VRQTLFALLSLEQSMRGGVQQHPLGVLRHIVGQLLEGVVEALRLWTDIVTSVGLFVK
jgi:hypothetical protein